MNSDARVIQSSSGEAISPEQKIKQQKASRQDKTRQDSTRVNKQLSGATEQRNGHSWMYFITSFNNSFLMKLLRHTKNSDWINETTRHQPTNKQTNQKKSKGVKESRCVPRMRPSGTSSQELTGPAECAKRWRADLNQTLVDFKRQCVSANYALMNELETDTCDEQM